MANLTTRFFGLELKSPVIAASSSMTGNLEQIKKIAEAGAGAIVLKSIFEEEIYHQLQEELSLRTEMNSDPEYLDYFDYVIKDETLKKYVKLVAAAKKAVDIPVIASINCISAGDWTVFAKKLEEAGADALELNLFIMPSDTEKSSEYNEQFYFQAIKKVKERVGIPVAIKISHYFSNLAKIICELSETGIVGISIFNRFISPDIDVDMQKIISTNVLSQPDEYLLPLRWTGILSGQVKCGLAATTGIHSAETTLKFLLAGAAAVQVASVLYHDGAKAITTINQGIAEWMDKNNYQKIDDFKGLLNMKNAENAAAFERVQFMKYFGGKEF
ncbi:MAG: dihydroorotate dehydrogenase-like protein [Prolixibacteraceae bacterium]|jgi:dihydroorotate dehydrogenase (fumarate)|nr:dihydroorotate dehydrogenase-like protein [Prolixibacteraceae bacterium]